MADFRNRPKGQYIFEADWQQIYILTEHWKSDLLFYKDDLKFLDHLIDKYFIWISKKENIDLVRDIELNLLEIYKQSTSLLKRVNKHLHHFAELVDAPYKYDSNLFRREHKQLENDIANYVISFRKNRKETFAITEHVIDSEKFVQKVMN